MSAETPPLPLRATRDPMVFGGGGRMVCPTALSATTGAYVPQTAAYLSGDPAEALLKAFLSLTRPHVPSWPAPTHCLAQRWGAAYPCAFGAFDRVNASANSRVETSTQHASATSLVIVGYSRRPRYARVPSLSAETRETTPSWWKTVQCHRVVTV